VIEERMECLNTGILEEWDIGMLEYLKRFIISNSGLFGFGITFKKPIK